MKLPFGSRKSFCPSSFTHLLLLLLRNGHFFPIETAKPTLKTQEFVFIQLPFVGVGPREAGVAVGHMVPEAEWHSKRPTAARAPTHPRTPPAGTAEKTTVPWRARIKKTYTEDLWSRASTCRWAAIWKEREILGSSVWNRRKTQKTVMSLKSYMLAACGPQTHSRQIQNSAIRFNQPNWIRSRHHILENSRQRHFAFWLNNKNMDIIFLHLQQINAGLKRALKNHLINVWHSFHCKYIL